MCFDLSAAEYDAFMQEHPDIVKAKNLDLDDAKKDCERTISEIVMSSEELTTVSADLLDDKEFLAEL